MSEETPSAEKPAEEAPPANPLAEAFAKALPKVALETTQGAIDLLISVKPGDLHNVLSTAKRNSDLSFDFLRNLCGVDYEDEGFEVVYHLYSYAHGYNVTIKCRLGRDNPKVDTASDIWRGADWHEREARDMFGIVFEGHPNLVPLLLPDDMLDHFPLRKDNPLAPLEEWQGELLGGEIPNAGYIPPGSGFNAGGGEAKEESA
ncbi:MAG TPA: NADH-quinone oxidoreductase subunit C [Dehalococcoidia bacterium]|nr:NADH-quinone oxidoreductase subunit C [Dehalococcoidia bacterium]